MRAVRGGASRRLHACLRAKLPPIAALAAICVLTAGCGGVVLGRAMSPIYDPNTAGGLAVTPVPSGLRPDAPAPTMTVHGGDGGDVDKLTVQAIEDIEEYWAGNYPRTMPDTNKPVTDLYSYDSHDASGQSVCGIETYRLVNAFFCARGWLIAWDRDVFMPTARKFFGDMAIPGIMGHEYGHAVQSMAHLVKRSDGVLTAEQQADCFSGDYLRWVAAGKSRRFTLDAGDGLNKVLAGVITSRDPSDTGPTAPDAHGTALDRVSAFQLGFISGATACADISGASIQARRNELPTALQPTESPASHDVPITEAWVHQIGDALNAFFALTPAPALTLGSAQCHGAKPTTPVSYCPEAETVFVDLAGLQTLGAPGDEMHDLVLLQGTNTAMSALASRYALAAQKAKGLAMHSTTTAQRTACLTGAFERHLAESPTSAMTLSSVDVDQAVAGLLGDGLVASDADGTTVAAGFNRIAAFRAGLTSTDHQRCYSLFPA